MAGGIKIQFLADVRDFLRGTKDIEKALDDTSDSLDDLAREATQSGDKAGQGLADGITDGTKESDQALGKLEKSFKDALDGVSHASKKAGDDLGHNVRHGAKEADDGIRDLKENTKQNVKETAASFSSVEDAIGGIQGLVAEAFEGFGPLGVVAGSALAAGIGVAAAAWQKQSQKIKDLSHDLTSALIEDGGRLTQDSIVSRIKDLAADGSITKLADQARKAQVDVRTFIRAVAGDPQAVTAARKQLDAYRTSVNLTADGTNKFRDEGAISFVDQQLRDQAQAAGLANDALTNYSTAVADSSTSSVNAAEQHKSAAETMASAAADSAVAATDAQAAADAYASTLEALADPVDEFNDLLADKARRGPVTIQQMIKEMEDRARHRAQFEKNLRTLASKGGAALVSELRAKGPEAAGAATALLARATSKQVRTYATARAKAVGESAGAGIGSGIRSTNLTPAMQSTMNKGAKGVKPPQVPIDPVLGSTRQAEADYAVFVRSLERRYPLTINVRGGNKPAPGGPQV